MNVLDNRKEIREGKRKEQEEEFGIQESLQIQEEKDLSFIPDYAIPAGSIRISNKNDQFVFNSIQHSTLHSLGTCGIILFTLGMFAAELNRVFTTSFRYRAWNSCLPFSLMIYAQNPASRRHPPFHSHCPSTASTRKTNAYPCASSPQPSIPSASRHSPS